MATNDFLPFATGAGARVISQVDWAALADRLNGFGVGVADELSFNKGLRQAAFVAAMIGQFTADYGGDALDDGDLPTLEDNFKAALAAWIASGSSPVDLSAYVLRAGDTMTGAFAAPAGFKTAAIILNGASAVDASAFGKMIQQTATSTVITTLPTPVGNGGARFMFWANSVSAQTLATPAGAFLGPEASGLTTMSVPAWAVCELMSDGYNWIVSNIRKVPATLPKLSIFQTSGTWTRASGAKWAFVLAHGPGGAGAGTNLLALNYFGDGGGAGSWSASLLDTSSLSSALCTIGAGGLGQVGGDGSNGQGDTSFSNLVIGKPGRGGRMNITSDPTGSQPGDLGTGQIRGYGNPGFKAAGYAAGDGGGGLFGGAGSAGSTSNGRPQGSAGYFGGGGGSSDRSTLAGGNGGDGFIMILEG